MKEVLKYCAGFDIEKTVDFAMDGVKNIIEKVGPRAPGSPEELKAQNIMKDELSQWTDEQNIEEFTVHRQAFMGFIPFTVACAIASVPAMWWGSPVTGLILVILGAIPLILEFLMYKRFCDPLFPGHPSHNVYAVRKPKGEVKKKIYLVGHTDSQYEWFWNLHLGGTGMKIVMIPAVVGLIADGVVAIIALIMSCVSCGTVVSVSELAADHLFIGIFEAILLIFIPSQIAFIFFQSWTRSVPGASDNLSGCFVGMSTIKALSDSGVRFENTEVEFIGTGSEEAGLRGSKAYVEKHMDELKDKNIDTCVVTLDTFRDLDDMAVYNRDLSGTVKHDKNVGELVKNAAANCGFQLEYASIYVGGSDAASFTAAKIPATNLAAMDPTPPRYYHTRLDTVENMNRDAVKAGIEIALETVCMFDENGLGKK